MNRHFPGVMQRFDWKLPHSIDMAGTGSIPELVQVGAQAAAGMDWSPIFGAAAASGT